MAGFALPGRGAMGGTEPEGKRVASVAGIGGFRDKACHNRRLGRSKARSLCKGV